MPPRPFGDQEKFKGYVTTIAAVSGMVGQQIEGRLGFRSGSLKSGYSIYALAEPVKMREFEWKDRTTYSDGWHFDPSIGEFVQRQDELRAQLGKQNTYSEKITDRAIAEIMRRELDKLNVRDGPQRIIKVISNADILDFPDSSFRNVAQWKLLVSKEFIRMARVDPGQVFE